jgi:thioredoxin-like negative regulator of GroEL
MEPIVNGLENEFAGDATVIQLNANEGDNERLQQQYGMRGHPTFAILDMNGRLAQTFIGPQTTEILREALTAVVETAN